MGTYIESNLTRNERIVYQTKFHWIIFISFKSIFTLFIPTLVDFLTTKFIVTNKRIIMKMGLIRRRTIEMNIYQVESVSVYQGVLGRILEYGTISVSGIGGSRLTFIKIANPLAFRKAFQRIK